ncbi:hypothetical protein POM88_016284 [Heracleum sosnowskyi]|uniref:Uncharacterized protein n=1 Tax=Heracleum sosnowskyi TaxID=360622 RepID=A0AAD8INK4_9APIA|nr:hypothetical protein POM88_016284 [Heracleum sosnowskyi]
MVAKLVEASAAEAEAANSVWQAAQSSSGFSEGTKVLSNNTQAAETTSDSSDTEADVRLHPRAVVVSKETVGSLGGMVRQLSVDQFEIESRRMVPLHDLSYPTKKFTRQKSPQGLHKKDLSYNFLNGSIPESLGQLTSLHGPNLNGNSLHGRVPAALGGRPNLRVE